MQRHTWKDWEMIETLRIARLPQSQWMNEITSLTARIRKQDADMDARRVQSAVNAACNAVLGNPDAFPKASARLRQLLAQGH